MIMLGSTCTIAIESDARMGNRTVCSNRTLPTAPSNSPPTTRHGRRAMGRMFFGSQFEPPSVAGRTYLFLDQII